MIKLTKLADYAVVLTSMMAEHPERIHAAAEIARGTHIPGPTAAKILGTLARTGLLKSHRGLKGGFSLARTPQEITVADVIRAVDGPIALTDCVEETGRDCEILDSCRVRGYWHRINGAVEAALEGVTLAEISAPLPGYFRAVSSEEGDAMTSDTRFSPEIHAQTDHRADTCPGASFVQK